MEAEAVNITAKMTDEELERRAFDVLARELGPVGYARFLRLFSAGRGDYTVERQRWQAGLTVDEIVRRMDSHPESDHG